MINDVITDESTEVFSVLTHLLIHDVVVGESSPIQFSVPSHFYPIMLSSKSQVLFSMTSYLLNHDVVVG